MTLGRREEALQLKPRSLPAAALAPGAAGRDCLLDTTGIYV